MHFVAPTNAGYLVLACGYIHCPGYQRTWRVPLVQIQPGLVEVPNYRCAQCGTDPQTLEAPPSWAAPLDQPTQG
jgi:hypothetical protein